MDVQVNSTHDFYQTMSNNLDITFSDLKNLTTKIVTENQYQTFAEMDEDGKLESILALQSSIAYTESYININQTIQKKMELQDLEVSNIISAIQQLKYKLVAAQSSSYLVTPLAQSTKYTLADIGNSLNAQYAGNYLFSGSKTSTIPLGDLTDKSQIDKYYGNEEPLYLQTSDTLEIQYNSLNANNPQFRTLFQVLHDIIDADTIKDMAKLQELQNKVDDALSWLITERADLEENITIVQRTSQSQSKYQQYLQTNLVNISKVTAEKFAEFTTLVLDKQKSLEAQFRLTKMLSTLNLASYL